MVLKRQGNLLMKKTAANFHGYEVNIPGSDGWLDTELGPFDNMD